MMLTDIPSKHPLKDMRGWRFIGSQPQEFGQFLPHKLDDHFDVIGFVHGSEGTSYLRDNNFE